MLLLSKSDIAQIFTMKDAVESDKTAFRLIAENKCDSPLRTNIQVSKYNGTLLFMPAYAAEIDSAVLKTINIFPYNINVSLPTSYSQIMLIDAKTGNIQAILDGTYVTQLRTGAASGAAFDILAKKNCKTGALIGTGGQAQAQLEAMLTVRDLEEVRIYSKNPLRAETFTKRMRENPIAADTKIITAKTSDAAVDNADLIITVTSSLDPVFNGNQIKPGVTISCVGSYQPHMQELDPVALCMASKIYFDSQEAVLSESGDIIIPLEKKIISETDLTGNLGNVINGTIPGRESDDEIIIFETVGTAAQDLVTSKNIYDKAIAAGIGTIWK